MDKKQLIEALPKASPLGVVVLYHIYQHKINLTEFSRQVGLPLSTVWRYVYDGIKPQGHRLDKVLGVIGEIDDGLMRAICDPVSVAADYARGFMVGYLGEARFDTHEVTPPERPEAEAGRDPTIVAPYDSRH